MNRNAAPIPEPAADLPPDIGENTAGAIPAAQSPEEGGADVLFGETHLRQENPAESGAFGEKMHISPEQYYQRVLPRYYIPSDEKILEAEKSGLDLVTILFNANTGHAVEVRAEIGSGVRKEVQDARKRLSGESLQSGYREIHKKALGTLYGELPENIRGDFSDGALELRYTTICRQPGDCGPTKERLGMSAFPEESRVATAAEMIDFAGTDWEELLGDEPFVLDATKNETLPPTNAATHKSTRTKGAALPKTLVNDLQKFRYALGRAMTTGDKKEWDDISREYAELMDHLPQYWEYRFAVQDLIARVKKGEIEGMPKTILSVASGPHVEAQAHMDLEYLYEASGLTKPEIFNLDISTAMIKKGEDKFEGQAVRLEKKDYWDIPKNVVGDMLRLPIKDDAFEMVECSSLDNLLKRAPKDVDTALGEMVRVLKADGLLRIVHKELLPETFFAKLSAHGLALLTAPHTTFHAHPGFLEQLERTRGKKFLERSKQKIFRGAEYILAQKSAADPKHKAAVFLPNDITETTEAPVATNDAEKAAHIKDALGYFLDMEGGGQLFNTHNRRSRKRKQVPYKALRKAIVYGAAKSLIEDADGGLVMKNGKPLSLKNKLAHYTDRKEETGSGTIALEEIALLDRPYREELLQKYAPFIYKELHDAGVFRGKGARPALTANN
ncbi:MAG: hypothetical protein A3C93_00965 [Candidatus Lloydbacteria bacterium RIFCSPHIGHO2_02_FULL_54_17]|uniref:Methyltransferase type 11 domain-containing protein n=1 Tax=Candidatus Lloydbacteria bacterium RIFCSPHIGHO2_02_FULL_54_17 TaxID=1798664 RepID=A0A1G2DFI2_9BACT|nr:MAG: hypothetical protein A2762_01540 [Candidatus Lloydbacteria bacterium RIFCSPHIGHO2_01_FULL_54_11]OGZ11558.1 MAG: hypothetical protein A3C93_00965 [Candidatus Lloydbacteria bacterium RIFCSPHIGHO2_02_FULL_54_17]